MAPATITKYINIEEPTMEVVMLTASDENTYKSRKFQYVEAAIACVNVDGVNDSISVCNSDNTALNGTDQSVRLNGSTLSSTAVILFLWGSG